MISIELTVAALAYVSVSLLLLTVWIVFEGRRKFVKVFSVKESLWCCPVCLHDYVDSHPRDISKCPRCQSLNVRRGKIIGKGAP